MHIKVTYLLQSHPEELGKEGLFLKDTKPESREVTAQQGALILARQEVSLFYHKHRTVVTEAGH